jgi:chromosome condensin MukBEF complex kleisin-like MukF subunit
MKLKTQIQLCFHSISRAREPQKPTKKSTQQLAGNSKIVSELEASRLVDFHISSTKHVVLAVSCKDFSICLLATRKAFTLLISISISSMKGREQPTSELVPILARLSKHHAEAVKLRVKALNRTVRGRTRSRNTRKKPDIRDVFRDVEVR